MKAVVYRGPRLDGLESRPKPQIQESGDAILKMVKAIVKRVKSTIRGAGVPMSKDAAATRAPGRLLGHEGVGFVDAADAIALITEGKRVEEERERLRRLEADLAYMNRVSMLGELAASLAHEIKQPITAAIIDANACMRWLAHDPPDMLGAREAGSRMVKAVTRAADIVDRVRSLYGRGAPEREVVDLNEILRETKDLLADTADRHSISIRTELDLRLPRTTADRVQLQQVLMNLMLNGIEAMREMGGELTVASKAAEQGQLLISVRDSGKGLPVDGADRIFEAFFTTKPQGAGMGLSISRRIVESHGGRLWASSPNAGRGAIFHFTLPSGEFEPSAPP
jgi:signal transduction histidine kinase